MPSLDHENVSRFSRNLVQSYFPIALKCVRSHGAILANASRTGFPASPKETEPKWRARTTAICLAATPALPAMSHLIGPARTHPDITRASPSMQKILAVDCLPQTVVALDEGRDEFMQAVPGYCDVILRRYESRAGMKCATSSTPRISAASIVALRSSHISRYDHWE